MELSVIIPTCNRLESLTRLLKALVPEVDGYKGATSTEIIIVDDASDEAYRVQLNRLGTEYPYTNLHIEHRPHRGGPGAARNSGIVAARGNLLAFIDDDCVPQPGYVAETLRLHRAYPDVLLINGNLKALRNDVYSKFWFHYYNAAFNRDAGELYRIEKVSSGHFSIKRELLQLLHPLFDEELTSREDYDLYLRLEQAEIPAFKADSIAALIECRRSLRSFLHQRVWYQAGELQIRRKYGADRIIAEQARHRTQPLRSLWYLYLALRVYRSINKRVPMLKRSQ